MKKLDLTNKKFHRLTALRPCEKTNDGKIKWECLCDCGKTVFVAGTLLKSGKTKSCGCLQKEKISNIAKTHGYSKTRLYKIWKGMRQRTKNSNNPSFNRYGERGITICKEWEIFLNFREWALNNGYSENLTIDRIDNNKGYSPDNCRWATWKEQANNKSNVPKIALKGELHTCAEWGDILGINYKTLRNRLYRYKWTDEEKIVNKQDFRERSSK